MACGKPTKGIVNRSEILHRFGYLSEVNVTGYVQQTGTDTNNWTDRTYLLVDLLLTDEEDEYLYLDHLWVKGGLFTKDMVGKDVTYRGEVQMYTKDSGRRSYGVYPLEILSVDEPELVSEELCLVEYSA